MVDNDTSSMGHSTFDQILVDIDFASPLSGDVALMVGDHSWTQPLDFEVLPLYYWKFFATSHLASECSFSHRQGAPTWWKGATLDHLTVYASEGHSDDSNTTQLDLQFYSLDTSVLTTLAQALVAPLQSMKTPFDMSPAHSMLNDLKFVDPNDSIAWIVDRHRRNGKSSLPPASSLVLGSDVFVPPWLGLCLFSFYRISLFSWCKMEYWTLVTPHPGERKEVTRMIFTWGYFTFKRGAWIH